MKKAKWVRIHLMQLHRMPQESHNSMETIEVDGVKFRQQIDGLKSTGQPHVSCMCVCVWVEGRNTTPNLDDSNSRHTFHYCCSRSALNVSFQMLLREQKKERFPMIWSNVFWIIVVAIDQRKVICCIGYGSEVLQVQAGHFCRPANHIPQSSVYHMKNLCFACIQSMNWQAESIRQKVQGVEHTNW